MAAIVRLVGLAIVTAAVGACTDARDNVNESVQAGNGGGGGGATPVTGILTDAPIEGVSYATATQSGVTNAAGEFQYLSGESVTFSIGGTQIGDATTATNVMTPFDLVPGAVLFTTSAQVEAAVRNPMAPETIAFIRLVNILVFLQSLDTDADPSNGISIPAGIGPLLAGVQIDFDADWETFRETSGIGPILDQAVEMGFLGTARLVDRARAMDHYYTSQGITTTALRLAAREEDHDNDGANDRIVRFSYDDAGHLTEEASDDGSDGIIESLVTFTYDENGNRTGELSYNMGVLTASQVETFDANSCRISRDEDLDGDSVVDRATVWTVEVNCRILEIFRDRLLNGTHRLSRLVRIWNDTGGWTDEFDNLDDGTVDEIAYVTRTANDDGTVIQESEFDFDFDGAIDSIERNTFDSRGTLLEFTIDLLTPDTPQEVDARGTFEFIYDDDGFLVEERETYFVSAENPDPFIGEDRVIRHEYDVDGILARSIFLNTFGTVVSVWTYTYEAGNWVSALGD